MAHKKRNPAAVATAAGAQGIAVSKNTATIAQIGAAAYSPVRRGPVDKSDWLVSIEGVCTDTPFRVLTLPTGSSPDAMWHAASTFAWRVAGCALQAQRQRFHDVLPDSARPAKKHVRTNITVPASGISTAGARP
jgi:hypothetical protein